MNSEINTYALDFETYYDDECSVTELGNINYVKHPLFECYLVSIVGEDVNYSGSPENAPWHLLHNARVVAHNASFEVTVFTYLKCLGIVSADVVPAEWHCTIDLCRFMGVSQRLDLKSVAKAALGISLSKDPRAKAKGMTGAEFRADPVEWKGICDYCLEDSVICLALWNKYEAQWPENERRLAWQTRQIAMQGIPVDFELIDRSITTLNKKKDECLDSIPWYPERKAMSPIAFRETCESLNLDPPLSKSTAKEDPDFVKFVEAHKENHPWVTAISDLRSANRTEKLLSKMKAFTSREIMRMHIGLKYYGGHTGRWSGRDVNIQNQTKKPVFGVDVRSAIKAGDNTAFLLYDYSQIEPRLTFWLAGDQDFLDLVSTGMSPYEAYARLKMGWNGGKLKAEDPDFYGFVKACVIALSYGIGGERFFFGCEKDGINKSLEDCVNMVKDYRSDNWRVCGKQGLWGSLEAQMFSMVGNRSGSLLLPSGRPLRYYNIRTVLCDRFNNGRLSDQLYASEHMNDRKGRPTYAGKILENVVQAIARDVLADAILRIEDEHDEIPLFTVHDEAIYEVSLDGVDPRLVEVLDRGDAIIPCDGGFEFYENGERFFVEDSSGARIFAQQIEDCMTTNPEWAKGVPLAVEGMITKVYTK